MKLKLHFFYIILVVILALSFWSSGIVLIRFLHSLGVWTGSGSALPLVYAISVPIIYVSIRGVQNFFTRIFKTSTAAVYHITGLVLMLHACVISISPALYLLTPNPELFATAWLLWFGGIVLFLQSLFNIK